MNGIEIPWNDVEIAFDDPPVSEPPQARDQPSDPRVIPPSRGPEEPITTFFAPEIERSLTSTLWHHSEFLDLARRELDFELHISVSAYRKILESIAIIHGEIGEADFECVVHRLREVNAFDECGGRLGLDQVFTDCGHYPEGRIHPEPTLREYVGLLKEYAVARGTDQFAVVRRYTRGHGYLQRNKLATKPSHPSGVGKIHRCCCGWPCTIASWPAGEEDTLDLTLTPER